MVSQKKAIVNREKRFKPTKNRCFPVAFPLFCIIGSKNTAVFMHLYSATFASDFCSISKFFLNSIDFFPPIVYDTGANYGYPEKSSFSGPKQYISPNF